MNKIIFVILLLACLILGYFAGVTVREMNRPEIVVVTDTLYVHDTIRIDRPVYISQRVVDTLLVPVTDTLRLHDTTFVSLPRMQREYPDSTYHAWVSGYEPALDSIDVYQTERIIEITKTITPKPKRWHLGVSAGYGAALTEPKPVLSPYVGVGVTYSLFSF